jgi:hypothetical protein
MSAYHEFTTARETTPDLVALNTTLKTTLSDPTVVIALVDDRWRGKKSTAWSAAQISAAQNALDTAPALTPRLAAQYEIDNWPIMYRALVLALIDALNTLRTHPAIGLPAITPQQAITSIRNKAGTL